MKRWQLWLGVLIGAACIAYIAFTIEDPRQFAAALFKVKLWYLAPIIASYFAIMVLRTWRWRYILSHVGPTRFRTIMAAILVCYMGNNIFPLRAGELMRVFLVGKKEPQISYSATLATVVVERLLDFLIMLVTLAAVLIFVPFPAEAIMITLGEKKYNLQSTVHGLGVGTLVVAAVLLLFLILLNARTQTVLDLSKKILDFFLRLYDRIALLKRLLGDRPAAWSQLLLDAIARFASGLVILGRPRALLIAVGMSVAVWAVNLAPVWLTGLAFGVTFSFTDCLMLLVVGAAAASIPGPPGFFGTFHAFNREAMFYLMGIDRDVALSIAIVIHACYYFPTIVAGLLAAWIEGYSLTQLRAAANEEDKPQAR